LVAFGFDSLIELVSAGVLIWRLSTELKFGREFSERGSRPVARICGNGSDFGHNGRVRKLLPAWNLVKRRWPENIGSWRKLRLAIRRLLWYRITDMLVLLLPPEIPFSLRDALGCRSGNWGSREMKMAKDRPIVEIDHRGMAPFSWM